MKTCGTCGEQRELEEFANDKRRKSGKGSECKICVRRRVHKYAEDHPEWELARRARSRDRNREKRRADSLARYYKQMEENPEKIRAQRRKYRNSPKGVIQARRSMRQHYYGRAVAEWWDSLAAPLCVYCGAPAEEVDHVIPVSKGGTHDLSNLAPACRRCNRSKGSQDVEVFLERIA